MLEITIKPADELSESEKSDIERISSETFALEEPNDIEWSNSDWHLLGKIDGRVVSDVGVLVRDVLVGQQIVRLGGVGGVATRPVFQRRGFAGQLMQAANVFMRDQLDLPFGLLVCGSERIPYYAQFGWQAVAAPLFIHQHGARVPFDAPVMIISLSGEAWPDGEIDLQGKPW